MGRGVMASEGGEVKSSRNCTEPKVAPAADVERRGSGMVSAGSDLIRTANFLCRCLFNKTALSSSVRVPSPSDVTDGALRDSPAVRPGLLRLVPA